MTSTKCSCAAGILRHKFHHSSVSNSVNFRFNIGFFCRTAVLLINIDAQLRTTGRTGSHLRPAGGILYQFLFIIKNTFHRIASPNLNGATIVHFPNTLRDLHVTNYLEVRQHLCLVLGKFHPPIDSVTSFILDIFLCDPDDLCCTGQCYAGNNRVEEPLE